jgi:hypothetical protein
VVLSGMVVSEEIIYARLKLAASPHSGLPGQRKQTVVSSLMYRGQLGVSAKEQLWYLMTQILLHFYRTAWMCSKKAVCRTSVSSWNWWEATYDSAACAPSQTRRNSTSSMYGLVLEANLLQLCLTSWDLRSTGRDTECPHLTDWP